MTYWEQRAVTEKLIAKRKARKPKAKGPVSGWANPHTRDYHAQLHPQRPQWVGEPIIRNPPVDRYAFFPSHIQ